MQKIMIVMLIAVTIVFGGTTHHAVAEVPSPLQQVLDGTPADKVVCNDDRVLMQTPSNRPVCVFVTTVETLEQRGFISISAVAASTVAASTVAASTVAASTVAASTVAASTVAASTVAASTVAASTVAASTVAASTVAASTVAASTVAASTVAASTVAASTVTINNSNSSTESVGIPEFLTKIPEDKKLSEHLSSLTPFTGYVTRSELVLTDVSALNSSQINIALFDETVTLSKNRIEASDLVD